MRASWKIFVLLVLIAGTGYFLVSYQGKEDKVISKDRRKAPPLKLPDIEGTMVSLSEFKGHVVLVDFWATWCVPCIKELPDLKGLYGKYKNKGFTILGVSVDLQGKEVVVPFIKKYQVPYPILLSQGKFIKGYDLIGLPTAYLIDRQGKIVKEYIGFKQGPQVEKDLKSLL